jgi:phosphate-selective porin OprO and OprP
MMAITTLPADTARAQASTKGGRDPDERGGLRLASGDSLQVTVGGYLQVDGRWIGGAGTRTADGMLLRRARLVFDVASARGWQLRLQPDFGQGRVLVQDAFVAYVQPRWAARAGRFRPAYGLERMQSSSTLLFPERGLINSLMPSRSMGAQVTVPVPLPWGGTTLSVGGFRTPIGSDAPIIDTDGDLSGETGIGHDLLARLLWSTQWQARYIVVQGAVLAGRERGNASAPGLSRILSVGQLPLLAWRDDGTAGGTALAAGSRVRTTAAVQIGTARSMLALEGATFRQTVQWGNTLDQLRVRALTVRSGWVVGGTRNREQEVTPTGARGALEFGLRAGVLDTPGLPMAAMSQTLAGAVATAGAAVSWLPTRLTRVALAYDATDRRRSLQPLEHALMVRLQQSF